MTERKPPGVDQGSWVEQQISAAIARGEFDDIPGQGRPIEDLDKPYDEVWFARKLRDEGFEEAMLPESLRLRRELERLPETVAGLRSETEVRRTVDELNERIEAYLRMPSGPPVAIGLVDPDQALAEWRERALAPAAGTVDEGRASRTAEPPAGTSGERTEERRRGWWRRRSRRGT